VSGRRSRNKGANAEREVRDTIRAYGFEADRDGRLAADLRHNIPHVHIEVKRCETWYVPAWWRQTVQDAGFLNPVLVMRRSREPWWAEMTVGYYAAHVQPHLLSSNHVYITRHGRIRMLLTTWLGAISAST